MAPVRRHAANLRVLVTPLDSEWQIDAIAACTRLLDLDILDGRKLRRQELGQGQIRAHLGPPASPARKSPLPRFA
jgi:hypothetical protein